MIELMLLAIWLDLTAKVVNWFLFNSFGIPAP